MIAPQRGLFDVESVLSTVVMRISSMRKFAILVVLEA